LPLIHGWVSLTRQSGLLCVTLQLPLCSRDRRGLERWRNFRHQADTNALIIHRTTKTGIAADTKHDQSFVPCVRDHLLSEPMGLKNPALAWRRSFWIPCSTGAGGHAMPGIQTAQARPFYEFNLGTHFRQNHVVQGIDWLPDFRADLHGFWCRTVGQSIDPKRIIRRLVVG
jgi:hypothetical protein